MLLIDIYISIIILITNNKVLFDYSHFYLKTFNKLLYTQVSYTASGALFPFLSSFSSLKVSISARVRSNSSSLLMILT